MLLSTGLIYVVYLYFISSNKMCHCHVLHNIRILKITVSCGVTPCSLASMYWHFRGACCLHHEGQSSILTICAAGSSKTLPCIYLRCGHTSQDSTFHRQWRQNLKFSSKIIYHFQNCKTNNFFIIISRFYF
jgi:hypothetical protein